MKILALDTSALTATVAVADETKIYGEMSFTTKLNHSVTIMPMIDDLLKKLDFTLDDIDIFACSCGPGSFTGLRIGIGTIKGLGFGSGKKVKGVCTLDALAHNISFTDYVIAPIMDARRNQVYNALYKFQNGKLVCIKEPRAIAVEELAKELDEKTVFVGDGVSVYRAALTQLMGKNALFAPSNLCLQRASSVAMASFDCDMLNPEELSAIYLRKPQAERELEEKNNI